MNGDVYSHATQNESSTITNRLNPRYYSPSNPSNTINRSYRHSYSQAVHEPTLQLPPRKQPNTVNQRHVYMINLQQQQRQRSHLDIYNFRDGGLASSTAYYDRIHQQYRSNTSLNQSSNLTVYSPKQPRETPSVVSNGPIPNNSSILSIPKSPVSSPRPQSRISNSTSALDQTRYPDELPIDYPHYTIDLLIQRLAPTDTYVPKQSFVYPMLLCSRIHIRPSLLLNKLARLIIDCCNSLTRDRSIRIMINFLSLLSQWTRTFPYDFRNTEMITQFDDLCHKIDHYYPSLQSDILLIRKNLRSKLQALEEYEEYIRQLNKKALNSLTQMALLTDIINECPNPLLFAQQLTHIELDRLKPIGAEELLQYFIMKFASEEARAHPNRTTDGSITSKHKSSHSVHDTKLTFCLETYVQWFNRLTFFVTTEIVKHTQRRVRIRLINYFLDTAWECFRLRNFNSMIAILGGLNMQPVNRLKRTWEKISLDKLEQLEQYTNVSRNFATYRQKLKETMQDAERHQWTNDRLVIPFTSIVLQDVYYIKTHSKDYTPDGGINLKKYYSMAKIISEQFVQCKQSQCSFERNDVIINYVITSPTFKEDSLMLASFECEPPISTNEKEKLSRLQISMNMSSS